MEITKMHGIGNSQILVEDLDEGLVNETGLNYSQIAIALCNENFGIGSDQMLIINNSEIADFKMRVFNRDGGEAEMCGNGIRCVALYLYDKGKVDDKLSIETKSGIKNVKIISKREIEVFMGKGKVVNRGIEVEGFKGDLISVGNPHFVIFTEKASKEITQEKGPILENAEVFQPSKTNVEFAKINSSDEIVSYVWERGAGMTLACGTGACATAFAAKKKGLVKDEISVRLLGGSLEIKIDDKDQITMSGPAEYILKGTIYSISDIFSNIINIEKTNRIN